MWDAQVSSSARELNTCQSQQLNVNSRRQPPLSNLRGALPIGSFLGLAGFAGTGAGTDAVAAAPLLVLAAAGARGP